MAYAENCRKSYVWEGETPWIRCTESKTRRNFSGKLWKMVEIFTKITFHERVLQNHLHLIGIFNNKQLFCTCKSFNSNFSFLFGGTEKLFEQFFFYFHVKREPALDWNIINENLISIVINFVWLFHVKMCFPFICVGVARELGPHYAWFKNERTIFRAPKCATFASLFLRLFTFSLASKWLCSSGKFSQPGALLFIHSQGFNGESAWDKIESKENSAMMIMKK